MRDWPPSVTWPVAAGSGRRSRPALELSVATSSSRMPPVAGAGNSCDSRCSPSTSAAALSVAPAGRCRTARVPRRRSSPSGPSSRRAVRPAGRGGCWSPNRGSEDRDAAVRQVGRPAAECRTSASGRASGTGRERPSDRQGRTGHKGAARSCPDLPIQPDLPAASPSQLVPAVLAELRVAFVLRSALGAEVSARDGASGSAAGMDVLDTDAPSRFARSRSICSR